LPYPILDFRFSILDSGHGCFVLEPLNPLPLNNRHNAL